MDKQQISSSDYQIFALKSLLWLTFGWINFLLTLTGFFYAWIAWIVFIVGATWITNYFIKNNGGLKISKELTLISIAIVLFVVGISLFTTPTIFSGRDQGSISQAAIRLAQNHKLVFETTASDAFFKLHFAGRALNFPGFFYTSAGKLITQFPLVYISWLASFYGILGINGFIVANAVLSVWFLFAFYALSRTLMPVKGSILALIFAATSLSVFWFGKFTLSENMTLPLVWLTIFATISFLKRQDGLKLALLLASSLLLIFTRIEGIAFFLMCAIIVFQNKKTRDFFKSVIDWKFFIFIFLLFLVFIANTFWDINLYREIAKALLPSITAPQATSLGEIDDPTTPSFYMLKIFSLYGMLSFFTVSAAALIFYARKKDFTNLIPFFIIAPTLVYFFNSHISSDHPWMLRRFAFSILPGAILYSAMLISDWPKYSAAKTGHFKKTAPIILSILLLVGNVPAFWQFATYSENRHLLEQTKEFSQNFSANDLILIDRLATGDGWSMIDEPLSSLFDKNSAYFFNPDDFAKLDLEPFDNVYLVAPDNNIDYYKNSIIGSRLIAEKHYVFSTSRLKLTDEAGNKTIGFPQKNQTVSPVTIYKISKTSNI